MSFDSLPDMEQYIQRGVAILRADATLFPGGYPPEDGSNLVTDVVAQEPPLFESSDETLLPYIYVTNSRTPLLQARHIGRDDRRVSGARMMSVEFYNIIVVQELTREMSDAAVQRLSQIVRSAYMRNLVMEDPENPADYLCATLDVRQIPYVTRSATTEVRAINVMVRPQVPSSLRVPN